MYLVFCYWTLFWRGMTFLPRELAKLIVMVMWLSIRHVSSMYCSCDWVLFWRRMKLEGAPRRSTKGSLVRPLCVLHIDERALSPADEFTRRVDVSLNRVSFKTVSTLNRQSDFKESFHRNAFNILFSMAVFILLSRICL